MNLKSVAKKDPNTEIVTYCTNVSTWRKKQMEYNLTIEL